jgi:hypothetical protein
MARKHRAITAINSASGSAAASHSGLKNARKFTKKMG